MVGVPGRSKACHNCRHRRIKCDGKLPGCHNCAKTKRVCSGYQRQHAFIMWDDSSVNTESSTPKHRPSDFDKDGSGPVMMSRWRIDQARPPTSSCRASSRASSRDTPSPSEVAATKAWAAVYDIPAKNIFRDKFFSFFIENDLTFNDSVKLTFGERNDWMVQVVNLPSLTPALEDALLAVCTARLGRLADRPALVQESLNLYTKSLSEMRRGILHESGRNNDQNVTACLALLLYEVTECPGGTTDGYVAHYGGTMQLLQMQGPAAFTSGLAHSVFQILRLHAVLQSIRLQERPFLAHPEWRDIPWSPNPATKAPFDLLVDILLELPGLSAQRAALKNMTDPQDILSSAVRSIHDGIRLESDLGHWFANLKATSPGPLYFPKLSTLDSVVDNAELGKLFPVAFHFPAFIAGQNMVYFWVALMSVQAHLHFTHRTLAQLLAILDSMDRNSLPCACGGTTRTQDEDGGSTQCLRHFTMESLPALGHREDWARTTAYNICQSVEYFLPDGTRGVTTVGVLPALVLVKGFWGYAPGDWSRQIAWVDDMLGRIRASGNGIAGTLAGFKLEVSSQ